MKTSDIEGIVLKSFKYQNSSLIGEIYTPSLGLRTFISKGLSSQKNAYKRILFRPPQIVFFSAHIKEHRNMNFLSDIDSAYLYRTLHKSVKRATIALFYIEVFRKVIYDGLVHPELYHFFKQRLIDLDTQPFVSIHIIAYLHSLAKMIGFGIPAPGIEAQQHFDLLNAEFIDDFPGHNYYLHAEDTKLLKRIIADTDFTDSYNTAEKKRLFQIYILYFRLQVDSFTTLSSPEIIKQVLLS